MSKMQEFFTAAKNSGQPISVFIPGPGWIDAKITRVDDDMVTISPPNSVVVFVVHYGAIWVRSNRP
jgi:hypothetical protein